MQEVLRAVKQRCRNKSKKSAPQRNVEEKNSAEENNEETTDDSNV